MLSIEAEGDQFEANYICSLHTCSLLLPVGNIFLFCSTTF